jgi:hypothetical protein
MRKKKQNYYFRPKIAILTQKNTKKLTGLYFFAGGLNIFIVLTMYLLGKDMGSYYILVVNYNRHDF